MTGAAVLWQPPADVRETTEVGRYLAWLERERGLEFAGYDELWRWSVEDLDGFWSSIWEFFEVKAHAPYRAVLEREAMPGAVWFPGARLNYAEHLLGADDDTGRVAIVAHSQTRGPVELTFGELRDQIARARAGLQRLGVGEGDRVVAYLPNIPETLVAFVATASLGAIWASCAPELGVRSVVDRLAQLEPTVLLAVDGYVYRNRFIDRREEVAALRAALPTLRHVVHVPYGENPVPGTGRSDIALPDKNSVPGTGRWDTAPPDTAFSDAAFPDAVPWGELLAEAGPLAFAAVPFDHPLFVLFSSGTTGKPKAIVHGHGGILLEHLKSHALSWDLKPGGRLLWFSTTSWMMWNTLVSALLVRSSLVMLDGDPNWPDAGWQWRVAAETEPSCMGASPVWLLGCRKAGLEPGRELDLSSIRVFGTAGSPLPAEGYRYVYEQLGPEVLLVNGSGGTDVCSGIVGGSPLLPVVEGEIAGPLLGVATSVFGPAGEPVPAGTLGELVITRPMPSMPVGLWGDTDGSLYRSSYFETFPGVWRQGDWILVTERGSCIVTGRSDSTLNRAGVRLGTGEFYGVVEELPEIADSLVIHLEDDEGGAGELLLFVVLAPGAELDDDLRARIAHALRSHLSARHVPDTIRAVSAIPRTLTGKKLEAPVKRILRGEAPEAVASRDSLLDPAALDLFVALAHG